MRLFLILKYNQKKLKYGNIDDDESIRREFPRDVDVDADSDGDVIMVMMVMMMIVGGLIRRGLSREISHCSAPGCPQKDHRCNDHHCDDVIGECCDQYCDDDDDDSLETVKKKREKVHHFVRSPDF